MRTLESPPRALSESGQPSFGSFRGGLPRLGFDPVPHGPLWRFAHRKRWVYAALCDEHVFAAVAVVSLGYASTCIVFALDRRRGEMLVDRSLLVPDAAVSFTDDGSGKRSARFSFGKNRVEVGDGRIVIDLPHDRSSEPVHILAEMSPSEVPPPLAAVVPIPSGYASATEKRIMEARGEVVAGGRRFVLDEGLVGLDHTFGYLARHTAWRWAFALGRDANGNRIAFNVTQGFVGEPECGVWLDDELYPIGEGRFAFDEGRPELPWHLTTSCGSLDLTFRPAAIHAEHKNLLVVRSKFIQPVGAFEGHIRVGGREVQVAQLAGVTEHQDVLW